MLYDMSNYFFFSSRSLLPSHLDHLFVQVLRDSCDMNLTGACKVILYYMLLLVLSSNHRASGDAPEGIPRNLILACACNRQCVCDVLLCRV